MQHIVRVAGRNAQTDRLQASAYPRNGAMVVTALDVDYYVKAALPFGDVIGHVRYEVGVRTIRLLHHTVFIITVFCALEPQRAFLLVGLASCFDCTDRCFDLAIAVER